MRLIKKADGICKSTQNQKRIKLIKKYKTGMRKAEFACFFSVFKIVLILPLFLKKIFCKLICVDRLVQSGTVPSQRERERCRFAT